MSLYLLNQAYYLNEAPVNFPGINTNLQKEAYISLRILRIYWHHRTLFNSHNKDKAPVERCSISSFYRYNCVSIEKYIFF